jgi:hypothetical protein
VIPIDLSVLIQAMTGIVNPTEMIRNKLARNETVIRLLKQFNLSPDSPPADFGGVYAYTLVEYGVGKPQVVLELFRQPEIRQAFQSAWGEDSFSVLLKTGEQFLENAALGDELWALGIDARQEFYQFAAVFIAPTQFVASSNRSSTGTVRAVAVDRRDSDRNGETHCTIRTCLTRSVWV